MSWPNGEVRELRIHERLPGDRHLDRLVLEQPARGVVVVRRHVEQKPTRVLWILARRPLRVAARHQDHQGLSAFAGPHPPLGIDEAGVVAAHVADLDDLVRPGCALPEKGVVLCQRGRARLLEEEVLSRLQHFDSQRPVVDRTGRQNDRFDLFAREELCVVAMGDSEDATQLLGAAFPSRRDRYEVDPWSPLGVLGVDRPHPTEAGHAEPQRRPGP